MLKSVLKLFFFLFLFKVLLVLPSLASTLELAFKAHQDGKLKQAEQLYLKALQEEENQAIIHFNLGNLYYSQEKVGQAVLSYKKVIELVPQFRDSYLNLGRIYYIHGNYIRALESFLSYYAQDSNDYETVLLIADTFKQLHLYLYAYDYYLKAIQVDPKQQEAYLSLADFFLIFLDQNMSLRYVLEGKDNINSSFWLELYEGDLLRQIGKPSEAALVYRGLLRNEAISNISPEEKYNVSVKMIDSLLDAGNENFAIYELEKMVEKSPNRDLGISYLENIYLSLQKQDRGFEFFKNFFSRNSKDALASIRNLLADAYNRNDTFLVKKIISFYDEKNIDDDLYRVIKNDLYENEVTYE